MTQDADLLDHARTMRRAPTEAEKRLWRALSGSQTGYKFRRQAVIGRRIADFLCPAKALVVEVDGETHDARRDVAPDAELLALGYTTIRVSNRDVLENPDGVLRAIVQALATAPDRWRRPHPNPSPEGEGLRAVP